MHSTLRLQIGSLLVFDPGDPLQNASREEIAAHIGRRSETINEPVDRHHHGVHPRDGNVDRACDHDRQHQGRARDRGGGDRRQCRQEHDDDIFSRVQHDPLRGGEEDDHHGEVYRRSVSRSASSHLGDNSHLPVHVDQAPERDGELVDGLGDAPGPDDSDGDRQRGRRGCGPPRRDPRRRTLEPVRVGVLSREAEKDNGQDDEEVDEHARDGAADEHAQVPSNVRDLQGHEIRQDEEEHADRGQLDEERDDDRDDALDLLHSPQQRRVGPSDQTPGHDRGDQDGQETVLGKCCKDVGGDEGLEDLHHDVVGLDRCPLLDQVLVVAVHGEAVAAHLHHQAPPHGVHQDHAVHDGQDGGQDIIADGPSGQLGAVFGHLLQSLDGEDDGGDDQRQHWSGQQNSV